MRWFSWGESDRQVWGNGIRTASVSSGSRASDRVLGDLTFDIDLVPADAGPSRTTAAYQHRFRAALADGQLAGWTCQSARKPPQAPMGRARSIAVD